MMQSRRLLALLLNYGEASRYKIEGLADDVLYSVLRRSIREHFGEVLSADWTDTLAALIYGYDQALPVAGQEGRAAFSRYLYLQLIRKCDGLPDLEEFDARFAKTLATLDDLITHARVPKLLELPRREFGEFAPGELRTLQPPEELSDYMLSLVRHFRSRGVLRDQSAESLASFIEKISSAPGYLRYLDAEKKHREVVRLFQAAREIEDAASAADPGLDDLIVSIGLLLLNLSPSGKIVALLSARKPSARSQALLYHYSAIMALHHLLSGNLDLAGAFAAGALKLAPDPEKKAYTLTLRSCVEIRLGDYDHAVASLREAAGLEIQGRVRAMISFYTGVVLFEKGEYANAIPCFEAAGRHVKETPDRVTVHNNIGSCALLLGDEDRADREFQAMERLTADIKGSGARQSLLIATSSRGAVWRSKGDTDKAVEYYRKALKIASGSGDSRSVANQLGNLGVTYARSGDYGRALQALHACLSHAERHGYWAGIRFAFWHISETLGQFNSAEERWFREKYGSKYPELKDL